MFVPLTIKDHIDRARLVYGTRIGIIDEPNQPASPLPELTYGRVCQSSKGNGQGV